MANSSEKQQFDIMGHKLVPIHEIISKEEEKELLEKFNITIDQLPKILDTDPVVIFIDAKPGQIIKVTRKSQTAAKSIAYRLVVESNK